MKARTRRREIAYWFAFYGVRGICEEVYYFRQVEEYLTSFCPQITVVPPRLYKYIYLETSHKQTEV